LLKLMVSLFVGHVLMSDYPIRMRCVFDGTVVEFVDLQEGTVVESDIDDVGEHCKFWMPHTDKMVWERCYEDLLNDEDNAHGETCG